VNSTYCIVFWRISDDRYNDKKVYVIDVSQSVEHDHPRSLEFLRMDIKNITDYFRKKGVTTLPERTAFEFITDENITLGTDEMSLVIENMKQDDQSAKVDEEVDERVFRNAFIPQNLFEVVDPERDVEIVQQGAKDDLIYAKFLDVQETKPQIPGADEESDDGDDVDEDSESTSSGETSEEATGKPRGKRHEDKDAKKVL
jgi:RIO kinase 1